MPEFSVKGNPRMRARRGHVATKQMCHHLRRGPLLR
jgi:hypothetical protein